MADLAYDYGLDELKTWTTDTFRWLLLKGSGYTPTRSHHFVSDLTPGTNEVAGSGYARVTASTKTRTPDTATHRIAYACDDPDFGAIVAGETVRAMVLYRFVTNDADSVLIGYYDIVDTPTNGTNFIPALDADGVAYIDQAT